MAGEVVMRVPLSKALVEQIQNCGFELEIKVDCSHAENFETVRPDRSKDPIMKKPIELDVLLKAGKSDQKMLEGIATMQAAKASSDLFRFYGQLSHLMGRANTLAGLMAVKHRHIKLEFSKFADDIFNADKADFMSGGIGKAVKACKAATPAAFNQLSVEIRKSMGMYQRMSDTRFDQVGGLEPEPRTAKV